MFNIDEYIPAFDKAFELSGQNTNLALQAIKEKGASAVTAVLVLQSQLGLSLAVADQTILDSDIWDMKGSLVLRDELFNSLNDLEEGTTSID
jgi:hypothetical protein